MIVVVEGPSAAGKTSWGRASTDRFVPEDVPTRADLSDAAEGAAHWTGVNSRRWAEAQGLEMTTGVAICDSDPLKLHYSWCLAAVGESPPERFITEVRHVRAAFDEGRLGVADLVVLLAPDTRVLREQRSGDRTRKRRSFELHERLREPLLAWYAAVEEVDPGRILRDVPPGLESLPSTPPRINRSDPKLLGAILENLPDI